MLNLHPVFKRFLKGLGATLLGAGILHTILAFIITSLPGFGWNDLWVALASASLLALEKAIPSNL